MRPGRRQPAAGGRVGAKLGALRERTGPGGQESGSPMRPRPFVNAHFDRNASSPRTKTGCGPVKRPGTQAFSCFSPRLSGFGSAQGRMRLGQSKEKRAFSCRTSHLSLSLFHEDRMRLGQSKEKRAFSCFASRLCVSLQRPARRAGPECLQNLVKNKKQ